MLQLRKKQIELSELFLLTAWFALLCAFGRLSVIYVVAFGLWSASGVFAWFITDSKEAIVLGFVSGIFVSGMVVLLLGITVVFFGQLWPFAIPTWPMVAYTTLGLAGSFLAVMGGGILGAKVHHH